MLVVGLEQPRSKTSALGESLLSVREEKNIKIAGLIIGIGLTVVSGIALVVCLMLPSTPNNHVNMKEAMVGILPALFFGFNENSTNTSNTTSQTNKNADAARDMTPVSLDVMGMLGSYKPGYEGVKTTVSGGRLDAISYGSPMIRDNIGGAGFACEGSFSEYMSMAPKIDSLRQSHKSPEVIVSGIYTRSRSGTGATLSSCILVDLKK